ncbi:MAG: hypothetical protein IPK07_08465 [Deltaproteobacteria bacterium]|nr:hypothetical protein [Deltaproteobacteria bacterium]
MSELDQSPNSRSSAASAARRWSLALAALAVAHVVVRVAWPIVATDALHDDYRQNWFWLEQVRAGVDFSATDPLTAYARAFQPPALAWLYQTLAKQIDPYLFTKWIGLVLVAPFAVALWRLGERSSPRGAFAPLLVAAGLLDEVWLRELMGGLARSYGPPLQLAVLASVVAGRWWLAVAWLTLAGLLHPQSLVLGASVVAVGFARARRARSSDGAPGGRAPFAPMAAAALVAVALSVTNAWHVRGVEARFGTLLTRDEVLGSVDYGPGGRFRNERPAPLPIEAARMLAAHLGVPDDVLVRVPPFAPLGEQLGWATGVLAVAAAALAGLRWLTRASFRDLPWWVPASVAVAAGWNAVAYLVLPRLYFPRRFLATYEPLAFLGALAWFLAAGLEQHRDRPDRAPARRRTLAVAAVLVLASIARFDGGPLAYGIPRGGYEGVARFLAAQPSSTRYAANPRGDADTLIAMVQRRIEIASELAHPLFRDYLEKTVRRRTERVTRALFPEDPARDVAALAADGVQLLVLRRRDLGWEELPANFAYEPVRSQVRAYWNGARQGTARSFWAALAARATVYEDDAFVVVDLRKLASR